MRYHYTLQDLETAFRKLNLKSDDNVFVFSSLGNLGILKDCKNLEEICREIWNFLKKFFSKGTIFVPAYSYTLGKNLIAEPAIFDPKNTKPEIGAFPEFVYKQDCVTRSLDPMVSICGYGKYARYVLENIPNNSYGPNSPFERLLEIPNSKCLTLGLDVEWLPYIHFIDYIHRVPFRYEKIFTGLIKNGKETKKIPWIYSVRCRLKNSEPDAKPIGKLAEKEGIWKKENVGRSFVCVCDLKRYFNFINKYMKKNPWILAKGPKVDVEKEEEKRVHFYLNKTQSKYNLPNLDNPYEEKFIECFEKITSGFNRFLTSYDLDKFLYSLAEKYNFNIISNLKTGDYLFGWILPEGWIYKEGYIKIGNEKLNLFPYIYSYPLKKSINIKSENYLKYFRISDGLEENEIKFFTFINEKDAGFNISKNEFKRIINLMQKAENVKINIDTNFYYKKYIYLKKVYKGKLDKKFVLITFANGPYKINENISALLTLLTLKYEIENKYRKLLTHTVELVVTYEKFGFFLWLYDNINEIGNIDSIIIINNISNPLGILSIYGKSNFSRFISLNLNEKVNFYPFLIENRIYNFGSINLKPYEFEILEKLQKKISFISYDYPYGLETYPASYFNTSLDRKIENKKNFVNRMRELIKYFVLYENLGGYYV